MSRATAIALAGGLLIAATALAQETFVGIWEVTIEVPGVQTNPTVWTVTERDGEYDVSIEGGNEAMNSWLGERVSLVIAFDGTRFAMTSEFRREGTDPFVVVNSGVIDGDTFEGTSKFGPAPEYRLKGKRR
jgi:hypothetical protein